MARVSAKDSTCHDSCHVAWPSGTDAILNHIIKPDETGVTGACISPPRLASGRRFSLHGLLARNLGASPHLELQDYRNEV